MTEFTLQSIGYVSNTRTEIEDDNWGEVISEITLENSLSEESLTGLEKFSHVTIIFYMNKVSDEKICVGTRYPRNNKALGEVGVLAQRGKNRLNKIGLTSCKLLEINANKITVQGLDAINGTPVLDIKPVFSYFSIPQNEIVEPEWVHEIMNNYFVK